MSNASDAFENALALLYFQATAWANVADNASSSPITNWQFSLHTSSPGDDGDQTTNEIGYTSYEREGVARSDSGFDVSGGVATLAANLDFTPGTGGSGTASHFGIGTAASAAGILHIHGAITPNIVCGDGVTPRLTTATQISIA